MADAEKTVLLRIELDTAQLKKAGDEAAAKLDQLKVKQSLMRGESKQGSLEYAKLSAEIRKTTKEVKDNATALSLHEKLSKKNTGSMQDMKDEMLAAKIALNQMSKEMREGAPGQALTKQIDGINESLKESEQAYGQFGRNVGNYSEAFTKALKEQKLELRAIQGEMVGLDADSERYKDLANRAGELNDKLKEVRENTAAATGGSGFEKMSNTFSLMKDDLANMDFQGVSEKMGAMAKISQQMTFKEAIGGMKNMVSSLASLAKAILVNPIFLIAGAVAGIVYATKTWIDQTEQRTIAAQEKHTAALERTTQSYRDQATAIRESGDLQLSLAISQGKSLEELQKLRLQNFDKAAAKELETLKALGKEKADAEKKLDKARIDYRRGYNSAESIENLKVAKEAFAEKQKAYKDQLSLTQKFGDQRQIIENETNAQIIDQNKATNEKIKTDNIAAAEDRLTVARNLQDLLLRGRELSNENEIAKIEAHYKFLTDTAQGGADELLKIEELKNQELALLNERSRQIEKDGITTEYNRQIEDAKGNASTINALKANLSKELTAIDIKYDTKRSEQETQTSLRRSEIEKKRVDDAKKTAQELELLNAQLNYELSKGSTGELDAWKKLQQARINLINEQKDDAVKTTQEGSDERIKIEKEAELEIAKIKKESIKDVEKVEQKSREDRIKENRATAVAFIGIAQQLADSLAQIQANQIQSELNADKDKFDGKATLLQQQLDAGLISQAEYNAQKSKLDSDYAKKESELKRKQFEANKQSQIINAIMGTAQGVIQGLNAAPPLSFIMSALAGALGAVQIGIIQSQPTPKFAKGGVFGGKSHSSGGTKGTFDDGTQIEVEKDEAFFVLNKRSTGMISRLSAINQAGGGVPLMEKGGALTFASGGAFSGSAGRSVTEQTYMQTMLMNAIRSIPNPIVDVKDINSAQSEKIYVEDSATFG